MSRASQVGPKTEQICCRAVLEGLEVVLAVVEDDAGEGVVHAVVDVVAALAVADGLADHLGHQRGGGGHQEPARLGEDFDVLREEPVELGVDASGQLAKRLTLAVVGGGEAAADVEQFQLVAALLGLVEDARRQVQGLHVVLEIGGLAADVEAQPLDDQPGVVGGLDQVHRLARGGAELRRQLDHRPGVGHADPQGQAGVRGVLADLADLLEVVVGHQRLVRIELAQRLVGLDRIGVDDLVPDEVLPLLGRAGPDVLVDDVELGHRGHVEAGPGLVERSDDRRVGIGLHRVVGLHPRQVLLELGVVPPQVARGRPRTAACRAPGPVF